MAETIERELGWDDEIVKDSEFTLIPAGDYRFTVTAFERGRYQGGEKLPPCNMAILTLAISTPDGVQSIRHNLFLHSKCEGMLSAFFTCIGLKKKGEPLRMNWNAVTGASGVCKVSIRNWKGKDGSDGQSNDIKKFYAPDELPAAFTAAQPAAPVQPVYTAPAPGGVFTPGKF